MSGPQPPGGPGGSPPAYGSGVADQPDPLLGRTLLDRYAVERKLGEGGMGSVYVARHLVIDKLVALKVLHGELVRKPELVERFLNEAKAASRIRHENVIDITDFGTTPDGLVFFAMELLDGRDLHDLIAEHVRAGTGLPWRRARPIFLQVCSALSAAHAAGILHRDLKPENIFLVAWLGHSDFVKLLDFGIAKSTEVQGEDRKLTRTGMLFGTPEYMSPEQARGDKPDHRVDVYAMGCILYQLIAGRVPFQAESFMGVLTRHLSEPVPPIDVEVMRQVGAPRELIPVIERAMAKDRDERFGSIDELADAVRAADGNARARRASEMWNDYGDTDAPPAPRSRTWLTAAVLVLLVFAGGAVAWMATRGDSSPAAAPAAADSPDATSVTTDDTPAEGTRADTGEPAVTAADAGATSADSQAGSANDASADRAATSPRTKPRKGDKPGAVDSTGPDVTAEDPALDRKPRGDKDTDKPGQTESDPTIGDVKTKDPFGN